MAQLGSKLSSASNSWVVTTPYMSSRAKLRLFCLPYAGGGGSIYRTWQTSFPAAVEICPIQLPGREMRLKEPHIRNFRLLLKELSRALIPFTDEPYALFGHSMGALLVYELALDLVDQGRLPPSYVFVSGRQAPHISREILSKSIHKMSDGEIVSELSLVSGSTFAVALQDTELAKLVLPTLRADLEVCQSYSHLPHPPIKVSMAALGGASDPAVRPEDLQPWQETVSGPFSLHIIDGNHLFVVNAARQVQRIVRDALLPLV
jgi:medium-chain acyl-[acyl-carrier-protein] hydrolase